MVRIDTDDLPNGSEAPWEEVPGGLASLDASLRFTASPATHLENVASVTGDVTTSDSIVEAVTFSRTEEGKFGGRAVVAVQSIQDSFDELDRAQNYNLPRDEERRKALLRVPAGTKLGWKFTPKAVTLTDGTNVVWPE